MNTAGLLVALLLIAANAFFVGYEFAILAAQRSRLEPMAEAGNRGARFALTGMSDLNRQLAGAQLGITMASLGLGFVAEPAIADLLGVGHLLASIIALAIVSFLHMLLGEMVPKNIAIAGPEKMAVWLAGPQLVFVTLLGPVIWFLNGFSNLVVRLCGIEPSDELRNVHTADDILTMVEASRGEGLIDDFDASLLSGALDFGDRTIAQVLVPRADIVAVPAAATVAELEAVVVASGHSRVPVYGSSLDEIVGFVHAKDLLDVAADARELPVPPDLLRPMLSARQDQTLESLLVAMRGHRLHVAGVRDRRGRTVGLITLEDVLEELVGEIVDESDRAAVVTEMKH